MEHREASIASCCLALLLLGCPQGPGVVRAVTPTEIDLAGSAEAWIQGTGFDLASPVTVVMTDPANPVSRFPNVTVLDVSPTSIHVRLPYALVGQSGERTLLQLSVYQAGDLDPLQWTPKSGQFYARTGTAAPNDARIKTQFFMFGAVVTQAYGQTPVQWWDAPYDNSFWTGARE